MQRKAFRPKVNSLRVLFFFLKFTPDGLPSPPTKKKDEPPCSFYSISRCAWLCGKQMCCVCATTAWHRCGSREHCTVLQQHWFVNEHGCICHRRIARIDSCRLFLLTPPFGPELTCLTLFFAQGYPTWKGEALQADKMWALFEGLVENGLTSYSHVLTGASCDLR
jgi:hypothetical protein